jgi:hypothetical protein
MFSIQIPYCDLNLLYQSVQAIRWRRVDEDKYVIINGSDIVLVQQKKDKKLFICSEDAFFEKWYEYLDTGYDYQMSILKVKKFNKLIKDKCFLFSFILKENRRLRILKQDLFETMIYYMLDEKNRNEKFEKIIDEFGEHKTNSVGGLRISWTKFPNPQQIQVDEYYCGVRLTEDEIKRITYLSKELSKNEEILETIKNEKDEKQVYKLLSSLYNDKDWIKNVMFYSLGFKNIFCITRSIQETLRLWNITPEDFLQFPDVKGFLLEFAKIEEYKSKMEKRNGNH